MRRSIPTAGGQARHLWRCAFLVTGLLAAPAWGFGPDRACTPAGKLASTCIRGLATKRIHTATAQDCCNGVPLLDCLAASLLLLPLDAAPRACGTAPRGHPRQVRNDTHPNASPVLPRHPLQHARRPRPTAPPGSSRTRPALPRQPAPRRQTRSTACSSPPCPRPRRSPEIALLASPSRARLHHPARRPRPVPRAASRSRTCSAVRTGRCPSCSATPW